MKSYATVSAAVALLSGTTEAFWRMPCHSRTAFARLDPIVDPGVASSHVHAIHGGSNFAETTTYDMLRDSKCTSCQFSDDKSAYWTPSLHFIHANGKTEVVPQIGGMLAYYLLLGDNLKAFPEGFQMLAGDGNLRNFTGPVPDLPTSSWTSDDKTQVSLGQKSLGFNCLNYGKNPEGSRYRHFLPDKQFMDDNCANGIRAEIFFPSCWNGKDTKSPDHKSHVAYPDLIDGGNCPKGYETRLPSLFYETIWNTYAFKGMDGQFAWSNGDPTGYGYHADFINGWNINTLQSAVDDCTNASGRVEDCQHFASSLQTEPEQDMCNIEEMPSILKHDNCDGPSDGLCGNVPVQFGPKYATALENGNTDSQTATVKPTHSVSVPTLSYASATAEVTDKWGGGVSVYSTATPEAASATKKAHAYGSAEAGYSAEAAYSAEGDAYASVEAVTSAAAKPVITPSPEYDAAQTSDCTTSTYVENGILYEIAIEQVTVTVTEEASYKARRHANVHRRRSNVAQH